MDESESMALGMDIGGSMIRVVVMPSILQDNGTRRRRFQRAHTQHTQRNKEQEPTIYHYKVPESIKVGHSSHYFTFLATCISSTLSSISASADVRSDTMIRGSAEEDKCVEVGISWSFPISPASSLPSSTSSTSPTRQTQTRPLKMGKGYEFTDSKTLTQSSLIPHFEAAFERVGIGARISIQWILNDTIAALVYAGHISRSCLCENQRDRENQGEKRVRKERRTLGIKRERWSGLLYVLGTGTNAAFVLPPPPSCPPPLQPCSSLINSPVRSSPLTNDSLIQNTQNGTMFNVELGKFNVPSQEWTEVDHCLNTSLAVPSFQEFEGFTSGRSIAECTRLILWKQYSHLAKSNSGSKATLMELQGTMNSDAEPGLVDGTKDTYGMPWSLSAEELAEIEATPSIDNCRALISRILDLQNGDEGLEIGSRDVEIIQSAIRGVSDRAARFVGASIVALLMFLARHASPANETHHNHRVDDHNENEEHEEDEETVIVVYVAGSIFSKYPTFKSRCENIINRYRPTCRLECLPEHASLLGPLVYPFYHT